MKHKINTLRTLPNKLGIAFSGGIDSSVLLDIAIRKGREVTLLIFDHKDTTSEVEVEFARQVSKKYGIRCEIGSSDQKMKSGDSKERFWSSCRNSWFNSLNMPVATGHNLNDATEWYLMTALTGNGGHYMNYSNGNIIRPLLVTDRKTIENYCKVNCVDHIVDSTNFDVDFNKRNRVRIELMDSVLRINEGIHNTIKRNIIRKTGDSVV